MEKPIKLTEKYERNGWPSIARRDLKPPAGWSLSLITSIERVRNHRLSPDGKTVAYIKDGETQSDVYLLPVAGGWPARLTTDRGLVAYWADEIPQWSPDGQWLAFVIDDHVHVASARGGLPKKISDFAAGAFDPKWMPDSTGLIIGVTDAAQSISFKAMVQRQRTVAEIVRKDPDVTSVASFRVTSGGTVKVR